MFKAAPLTEKLTKLEVKLHESGLSKRAARFSSIQSIPGLISLSPM